MTPVDFYTPWRAKVDCGGDEPAGRTEPAGGAGPPEAGGAGPPEAARPSRTRLSLALAVLTPALCAAVAVALLTAAPRAQAPPAVMGAGAAAPALAQLAELTPAAALPSEPRRLLPVIATEGRSGVAPPALEPLAGGIRPAPPARIRIPAARVDATVQPVAAGREGIAVPPVGRAGWLEGGPRPGEAGRSVVIGHLDGRRGPGLFAHVPRLPPGTPIEVTDRRGEVRRFHVVGSTRIEKARFPEAAVYGGAPAPVLVLITCGGPYRPGKGYRDNVLVYARAA